MPKPRWFLTCSCGWTRECWVGARNEVGEEVVGTSPQAVSWCLNGAINRALLDVLGLNWYEGRFEMGLWMTLRRPVRAVLRERSLATSLGLWNDLDCPNSQAAEDVLRAAAARLSPWRVASDGPWLTKPMDDDLNVCSEHGQVDEAPCQEWLPLDSIAPGVLLALEQQGRHDGAPEEQEKPR